MNLYYTDEVYESYNDLQHNCLYFVHNEVGNENVHEQFSFCLGELPSDVNIGHNNFILNLTFADLSKQNITSQQLYLWSAPIDIIERYQFYLNQLSTENDLSLAKENFYNCTMPRFGPMCQYQLHHDCSDCPSLITFLHDFYRYHRYNPTTLTCYNHLKCNRGPYPSCLDWTEICDGKIDCIDGGFDEENCWQLEINQCKDDEYRCHNGQCIPQSFYNDRHWSHDCVDNSDERIGFTPHGCEGSLQQPFKCEDVLCHVGLKVVNCVSKRQELLLEIMHSNNDTSVSEKCWSTFKCLLESTNSELSSCDKFCELDTCIKIVQNSCLDMIYFPNVPILFGNIYFVYKKSAFQNASNFAIDPFYICYNTSQYDVFFSNVSKIFYNNMNCIHSKPFIGTWLTWGLPLKELHLATITYLNDWLKQYHLSLNYTDEICNKSNMYQCAHSSKCISRYRLMDMVRDCPHMDDENISIVNEIDRMKHFTKTHFKCPVSGKYIHQSFVYNGRCDCETTLELGCEDEQFEINNLRRNIIFQHICDGFIDQLPVMIGERNETDETECAQWSCINIYTRCNKVWNCPNGEDEIGCTSYSKLNCSSKSHFCVLPDTNQFICLPIEKVNDGNIDCLGGTDEPKFCGTYNEENAMYIPKFYCRNTTYQSCIFMDFLCLKQMKCEYGDDIQFCERNLPTLRFSIYCLLYAKRSDLVRFFCDYHLTKKDWEIIYFKLDGMNISNKNQEKNMVSFDPSMIEIPDRYRLYCHRGIDLLIWLNNKNNLTKNACLCPPNFYGSQCQYQNQRIILNMKFRALASSLQIPFSIIISLIDDSDKRIIHSYEQFTYLSVRDCKKKFNFYLIYSTRPKNPLNNYLIHIDFYEKFPLNYRASVLLSIPFSFLPVHRLSFIVDIPQSYNDKIQKCSNQKCIYGKCIKYSNNPGIISFCKCNHGWSGKYCNIQHTCQCASDSLCIGISANNRSICVCSINKFGPRCLLTDKICQSNFTCQNGGQCISNIDYLIWNIGFVCICPKGFTGTFCETAETKIILSFEKNILLREEIFFHFIDIQSMRISMEFAGRITTFQRIPIRENSIIIYWSQPFHLVFVETFEKNYYLAIKQNIYEESKTIVTTINSSNYCPHIRELFNESFIKLDLIRRIKYYHLPCQTESLNLSCFYDEKHFCLCYQFEQQRLSNCFKFDHKMKMDCLGQNECENNAQCVQDKQDCPTKSLCICRQCFYGIKCQFNTRGFDLSLDAILGYYILPGIHLTHQPTIVQFSLIITIIFVIVGLILSFLSIITFKNKTVREVGCGLYLLVSSIITLLIMIIFGLKFVILLLAQMSNISNQLFLLFQCHSFDFILRICLFMDQWLHACIAFERVITTRKGSSFVKKKSRQTAKLLIFILLFIIIGTSIHDPIYRRLIDEVNNDNNETRTWCIITYSFVLQIYNNITHVLHLFGPFMINVISAIILIKDISRQEANVHKKQSYKVILRKQFQQRKNLLIAPILLLILTIPRIMIVFVSKCMESTDQAWLYLVGYFISFIPPMSTYFIFILPSEFYRKELAKSLAYYRAYIRRCLHNNTL